MTFTDNWFQWRFSYMIHKWTTKQKEDQYSSGVKGRRKRRFTPIYRSRQVTIQTPSLGGVEVQTVVPTTSFHPSSNCVNFLP